MLSHQKRTYLLFNLDVTPLFGLPGVIRTKEQTEAVVMGLYYRQTGSMFHRLGFEFNCSRRGANRAIGAS